MNNPAIGTTGAREHAAIFLDYENLLYHLKEKYMSPSTVNDVILEILRALRNHLSDAVGVDVIVFKAYADLERANLPLGSLYLMGVEANNVLGTDHKNAADMKLCIDLMEVLYTRQDITQFILVAGDRDYIPVVQHLRKQAKRVRAVAFRDSLSGDLLEILGKDNFLEADQFITEDAMRELLRHKNVELSKLGVNVVGKITLPPDPRFDKPAALPRPAVAVAAVLPTLSASAELSKLAPKKALPKMEESDKALFPPAVRITHTEARECLEMLLKFLVEKELREVWLSPFLRMLTDRMPLLADWERKELITVLGNNGAIRVEKRQGDMYDFSVILINFNHPDVVALMP